MNNENKMTLKEFYIKADGDYVEAMERLGKEEIILECLRKLPEAQMLTKIRSALDAKEFETALRDANVLKEMCLNIALIRLMYSCSDLADELEKGPADEVESLFELLESEYNRVTELILSIE